MAAAHAGLAEAERRPDGSVVAVLRKAVAAFNAGDQSALDGAARGDASVSTCSQALLGCGPGRVCRISRPMPLVAGEHEVSVSACSVLDNGRAVCTLRTADAELVGIYKVADGAIVAGCHYFSDLDLLARIGTLPGRARARPAGRAVLAAAGGGSATLGDALLETRLAHRLERLRLVIHAQDERLAALAASGRAVPHALLAAIQGFQHELLDVRRQLHALRRLSESKPPNNRRGQHEDRRRTPTYRTGRDCPGTASARSERPGA
jgi:hypothetical protein